jgi:MFS family permease
LSGPSPTRVLAGTAAVTTVCVLPSFLLGAMAVQVGRDLGIDPSGIGLAFGAFFAAASVASAPLGRVTEARGPVWSLRVATVVTAGSCLVTAAVGRSLATLLAPIAVAGAANALCQPAANLLLARAVPAHRQGFAFATKQSAIPFATLLAGVAVPALALTVGWRWAFVGAAGLAVAAGAGLPDVGRVLGDADRSARDVVAAGRPSRPPTDVPLRVMATLAVGIGFGAAAGGTLGSFLVSAAVDGGLSEGAAGWLLTAGSIAGITVRLLAGVQADRRDGGHLRVVATMLLLGAGAFGVLAIGEEWTYLLAGPAGFMTAWAWPGLFNLAVVRANPARPAAATGITQTGTYVGAVSGPLLFGFIAEHASFRVAWLVAAVFALVGSAAMLAGRRALRAWRASAAAVDATGAVSL